MPDTIYFDRDANGNFIVPDSVGRRMSNVGVCDLSLTSFDETTGAISYNFKPNNNIVAGSANLVQRIAKAILTIKGSSAYDPTVGSNFFSLFSTISVSEIEDLKATFPMFLKTVEEDLIAQDAESLGEGLILPLTEQIDSLTMESVEYDVTFGGWLIDIRVRNRNSASFVITI